MNISDVLKIGQFRKFYQQLKFEVKEINGKFRETFKVASHIFTNDKGGIAYQHRHSSFYTKNIDDEWEHALDITFDEEVNEIHPGLPVVFGKYRKSSLIMKGEDDGQYYEVVVLNGQLTLQPARNPILANKYAVNISELQEIYPEVNMR